MKGEAGPLYIGTYLNVIYRLQKGFIWLILSAQTKDSKILGLYKRDPFCSEEILEEMLHRAPQTINVLLQTLHVCCLQIAVLLLLLNSLQTNPKVS